MASPPSPPLSFGASSPASLSPTLSIPSLITVSAPPSPPPCTPTKLSSAGPESTSTHWRPNVQTPPPDSYQAPLGFGERMAPRPAQRGGRVSGPPRREADFSTILTTSQKDDLMAIFNAITNAMQTEIVEYFCPGKPSLRSRAAFERLNFHDGPQEVNGFDGTQNELRKEALAAVQKWLGLISKRFSDISVVPKDQYPQNSLGRNFNGKQPMRGSGRGGAGRAPYMQGGGGRNGSDLKLSTNVLPQAPVQVSSAPGVTLAHISVEKRQMLIHALVLLCLSLDSFSSYSHILISRIAAQLGIPQWVVAEEEERIALGLAHAADSVFHEEGILKRTEDGKRERRVRPSGPPPTALAPVLLNAKIGSIAAGASISPPAAGSILGTMGTMVDGGLASCILFGLCGPRGSPAKTLDIFAKDIQDVGLLPLHGSKKLQVREGNTVAAQDRRLRLTIAISGWAKENEEVTAHWSILGSSTEAYALAWEKEALEKTESSIRTVMSSTAWKSAKKNFADRNIFANISELKWPNSVLRISKLIDNPWSVGMVRADKVGIALADAIVHKVPGERGVSLLGFGLGARVIYTCLMSLSERRVFGQVENVVMMGTPAPSAGNVWTAMRSVVAGRLINVFSENDHILGFMNRTGCVQFGIAGLQRIGDVKGVENVNASKPIDNHLAYAPLLSRILRDIKWEDLDPAELKKLEKERDKAASSKGRRDSARMAENVPPGRTGNEPGRRGRGKSGKSATKKKMENMEDQFRSMSLVH